MRTVHAHRLAGKVFGRLTVLDKYEVRKNIRYWLCRCECSNEKFIATASLVKGRTTACGCRQFIGGNIRHGMTGTRIHNIWKGIKTRCNNPNATYYENYGGRGVKVCDRWMESFENFYEDMKEDYADDLTIEREDNDGNYEKDNCYWATRLEQGSNSRKNVVIDTPLGPMHIAEVARAFDANLASLYRMVRKGIPLDEIFTKRHKPKETTPWQ